MAVKSGPGEASARRGREEYDDETDRIVAALSDPAEPIPAAEVLSASPDPSTPTTTPAPPVAAPAPQPQTRSAAVSSLQRRSRAAWGERIVRLIMALIMASLLWIYVLDLDNPAGKWTADQITVEAIGTPDNLSPRTPVGSVNITAQAPQDVTARLRGDSFSPHVNLAGLGPGVHTVDVEYTTPPGVLSVTIEPAQLTVQLIQQGRITLPAQLRLQGEPSLSYKVVEGSQQVTPSEVTVVGPLDAIQRVNAVVAEINIDNRQGTVQGEVQPRALDFSGQEVLGVKYNPTTVGVKVEIEQLLGYKSLPVNVPITGQPAPGYLVTSIDVQPTTFNFYGLPSVLEPLNSLETNPVDISGLTQTLRVDVTVPLTDGMTLYPPGTSNRVQVKVEIEELSATTKLSVPVQIAGLSPGLQAKASPDHIDVTIGGAVNLLQGLTLDDVIVSANVTNYGTGNYTVQTDIALPTGTTLINTDPDKVRVDISPLPTPTPTVTATPLPTQTPTLTATPTITPEITTTPTPEATQDATTPEPTVATPPQPTP